MKEKPQPNFHVYVPVGVSHAGRELFRTGVITVLKKFAVAEKKHAWNDLFITCSEDAVQEDFRRHIEKGDPRDVIIYCLIMIYRGWTIK